MSIALKTPIDQPLTRRQMIAKDCWKLDEQVSTEDIVAMLGIGMALFWCLLCFYWADGGDTLGGGICVEIEEDGSRMFWQGGSVK